MGAVVLQNTNCSVRKIIKLSEDYSFIMLA